MRWLTALDHRIPNVRSTKKSKAALSSGENETTGKEGKNIKRLSSLSPSNIIQ